MSSQVEIRLKAYDEASKTIADASSRIKSELREVEAVGNRVQRSQAEVDKSSRQLVTGFSGVATSAFALYSAVDRVRDMQVSVDRANLQVNATLNSLEDAQRKYNVAVEKYGVDSEQAAAAAADLSVAQERYQVAVERAQMLQGNLNETIVQSAISVVPTAITMVDSLSKVWRNFPDISGVFNNVSGAIGSVGVSAQTAALGVGALAGAFIGVDALLHALPEDIRTVAGALTASIAAIVAATVAWMAFHGTMTVGAAVPIILAAVGAGIAGIKAAVGMAEGGIVTKPTLAVIGERGPEVVVPLARFNEIIKQNVERTARSTVLEQTEQLVSQVPHFAFGGVVREPTLGLLGEAGPELVVPLYRAGVAGEATQYITVYPTINVGNVSGDVDLARVTDAVNVGVAEALRRRL